MSNLAPRSFIFNTNPGLFDQQPLVLHGFTFKSRACIAEGRPSLEQWQAAFTFASAAQEATSYWVGDLLTYAESRADYAEKLSQMVGVTGLAEGTIHNMAYTSRHVAPAERAIAQSPTHALAVAPMEVKQQRAWLKKSRDEGWTTSELRNEIRAASRRKVIEGQATLAGMYRVIYADPPWRYRDSNATADGSLGKAERHYPSMSMEDLAALPVAAHALPHSVLFCWVTTPMLLTNPGPRDVIEAWGFKYKSLLTWDKGRGMPGRFFQITTEHLIVAERGQCPPEQPTPKPRSAFAERREEGAEHSSKPHAIRMLIEKLYPTGPYVELFAREKAEGWDSFGNDPRLWS